MEISGPEPRNARVGVRLIGGLGRVFRFFNRFSTDGDVDLEFDYRLVLGDKLATGQILDLIVSLNGVDITQPVLERLKRR